MPFFWLFFQNSAPAVVQVDTQIPLTWVLGVFFLGVGAWAVALHRITRLSDDQDKHVADKKIHQDAQLIDAKFELVHQKVEDLGKSVDQRFDGLGKLVQTSMENLCDRVEDLKETIKKNANGKG